MKHLQGKLIFIAGLPGSGKSRWMNANTPQEDFFVVDDFMANSYHHVSKFTYSRYYVPLIHALRSGRDSVISDIAFCAPDRRVEAERVMGDAIDELNYRWIFFENAKDACRENIVRRACEEGRGLNETLAALDQWSEKYVIPPGSEVIGVYRKQ